MHIYPQARQTPSSAESEWLYCAIQNELANANKQFLQSLMDVTGCNSLQGLLEQLFSAPSVDRLKALGDISRAMKKLKKQSGATQHVAEAGESAFALAAHLAVAAVDQKLMGNNSCFHDIGVNELLTADIYKAGVAQVPATLREKQLSSNALNVENGPLAKASIDAIELCLFLELGLPRVPPITAGSPLTEHEHDKLLAHLDILATGDRGSGGPQSAAMFIRRDIFKNHTLFSSDARQKLAQRLSDGNGKVLFRIIVWGGSSTQDSVDSTSEHIPKVLIVNEAKLVAEIENLIKLIEVDQ